MSSASTRPVGIFAVIQVYRYLGNRRLASLPFTAVLDRRRGDVGLRRKIWEFKVLNETIIIYYDVILGAFIKLSS